MSAPEKTDEKTGEQTGARRRRLGLVVLAALAALVVAAVVVLGVMAHHRQQVTQARTAGLDAARERTAEILSFDPANAPAQVAQARELVAGPFADQFGALIDELVAPSLARGLTVRTQVTRAAVVDAAPGRATTLLFLEQTVAEPGGPPQRSLSRARVTVEEIAGQWLITDLQSR